MAKFLVDKHGNEYEIVKASSFDRLIDEDGNEYLVFDEDDE